MLKIHTIVTKVQKHYCLESPKAVDTLSTLADEQGWWRRRED